MQPAPSDFSPRHQTASTGDQLLAEIIANLFEAAEQGRSEVPLAAICKRLQVRMSTLQRHLSMLEDHALLESSCDAAGRWTCHLTELGINWYTSAISHNQAK